MAHGLSPVRADPANRFDLGAQGRSRIIVETNLAIASPSLNSRDENGCGATNREALKAPTRHGTSVQEHAPEVCRALYLVAAIWLMFGVQAPHLREKDQRVGPLSRRSDRPCTETA